jgi:hypothetical protein
MLGAFFDDNGTHGEAPVVAMGGLLGTEQQWDVFAYHWDALLKEPIPGKPRLSQFHLYPCRRARGEFIDYNLAERDLVTRQFREVILRTRLVTLASAVDKRAWDELVVGEVAQQAPDPLEFVFFKCVEMVTKLVRQNMPSQKVWICFDEGTRPRVEKFGWYLTRRSDEYPEIAGIGFAPVKAVVALQGADMIAYETFLYGVNWLANGGSAEANPHFRDFEYRDLSAGLFLQRAHIEEMVARIRDGLAKAP